MAKALKSDKKPLPPIYSANNGIVITKEEKAAAFAHSLEIQCQTNIDPNAGDEHMDLVEEIVEDLREKEPDDNETNPDEVQAIIQSLKPWKAPGPDQIPNKALKNSSDEAIIALVGIVSFSSFHVDGNKSTSFSFRNLEKSILSPKSSSHQSSIVGAEDR